MKPAQKLLLLYTGGTIGMQMSATGLIPASGFEVRLRAEQAAHPERPVPNWLFHELLPPLDSANMTQANWLSMCAAIVAGVDEHGCDGVLLLHGTDTLAYSAAALSFLLLGLKVPVILTGSMQPAGVANGDAWPNLFGALALLASGVEAGVYRQQTAKQSLLGIYGQPATAPRPTRRRTSGRAALPASTPPGERGNSTVVPRFRRRTSARSARQWRRGPAAGVLRQRHRPGRQSRTARGT
jgi:hypothetical protein